MENLSPLEKALKSKFGEGWFNLLREEFNKNYFLNILKIVAQERKSRIIYPEKEDVYKAFELCPLENTKVVILGQDPYHDGNARGLAFGTTQSNPSLQKILKQLEFYEEFGDLDMCVTREPTLEYLASQGVLLLNRVLTVRRGKARSHAGIGWEIFTSSVLNRLSALENRIVFMLWGRDAQEAAKDINRLGNLILITEHPAFAARENRPWKDDRCFQKVNEYLEDLGKKKINW